MAAKQNKKMSITVKNLTYIYSPGMPGETLALDDVSFEVPDASTLGIIGHTGSGKSTLLQHLDGLLKPTSGEVYINDVCITDSKVKMSEIRRRVGLVFQYPEYQLFEETVAKDVAFGPLNLGLDAEEIDRRVRLALERVGLDYEELKDVSPFELSGGMKRRVAIAGVIAMEPDVLIMDEPTAGLDPAAHRDILAMIRRLREDMNMILIFVSHNMADIADLSDKILVMKDGRAAYEGSPQEVFKRADELRAMGLSVPPAMEITEAIGEKIKDFKSEALSIDDAANDIKAYLKKR